MKEKIGIIDVGGGMRDVFAAGVLDGLLDEGISVDYCIGISAGSGNLTSFLAGQRGRNHKFYVDYAFRKEYISLKNYLKTGNYVNLEYAHVTLAGSKGEDPLDYTAFESNPAAYYVVACNAVTGETKYFGREDIGLDNYDIIKASSTLPVVNKPYMIKGTPYYDGGLADPVPVEKAFADGCDKVILILSRPRDYVRTNKKDSRFAKLIQKKYPKAAKELCMRAEKYNRELVLAKEYEKEGKLLILAPDDCCGVDTLTKDRENIQKLYDKGIAAVKQVREFLGKGKTEEENR